MPSMNILLTNDDGIHAPGIRALRAALAQDHQVTVVAPETEQSAVGHSITLVEPVRVKKINKNGEFLGFALSGTPADCVRIGCMELVDATPDLVVSGINQGGNLGINVLYSGTVSAANEAAIMGLPAMALSLNTHVDPDFSYAADLGRRLVGRFFDWKLPPGVSLNVNVPALPAERVLPPVWARQSLTAAGEAFECRVNPRGSIYYWRGTEIPPDRVDPDTDYALLAKGHVTLTPLQHDLTHHQELARLAELDMGV